MVSRAHLTVWCKASERLCTRRLSVCRINLHCTAARSREQITSCSWPTDQPASNAQYITACTVFVWGHNLVVSCNSTISCSDAILILWLQLYYIITFSSCNTAEKPIGFSAVVRVNNKYRRCIHL